MGKQVLKIITDFKNNGKDIVIFRDQDGKWYCQVNGITTQKRLNASEIVRWLAQVAHQHTSGE